MTLHLARLRRVEDACRVRPVHADIDLLTAVRDRDVAPTAAGSKRGRDLPGILTYPAGRKQSTRPARQLRCHLPRWPGDAGGIVPVSTAEFWGRWESGRDGIVHS